LQGVRKGGREGKTKTGKKEAPMKQIDG
jgi:hypothetical protein